MTQILYRKKQEGGK